MKSFSHYQMLIQITNNRYKEDNQLEYLWRLKSLPGEKYQSYLHE